MTKLNLVKSEKRGVGRPVGAKANPTRFKNWQPKEWTLVYDRVLFLSVLGKSNKEIGEICELSSVHIGNILSCEIARVKKNEIRNNLGLKDLAYINSQILAKATDRIKAVLDNDTMADAAPIAMANIAFRAIDMAMNKIGVGENGKSEISPAQGNTTITNNTLVLASQENVDRMLKANDFTNRIAEIHGRSEDNSTQVQSSGT